MRRLTVSDVAHALAHLAEDAGVTAITVHVDAPRRRAVLTVTGDGPFERGAAHGPAGGPLSPLEGDQGLIDKVLGRGEYQP